VAVGLNQKQGMTEVKDQYGGNTTLSRILPNGVSNIAPNLARLAAAEMAIRLIRGKPNPVGAKPSRLRFSKLPTYHT